VLVLAVIMAAAVTPLRDPGGPHARQGTVVTEMTQETGLGGVVATSVFGPNGQRVMALLAYIAGLSAGQVDQVTRAWSQGSRQDRARAWAQLTRATAGDERCRILAAAPGRQRFMLAGG
jgi:hypothetical protein